MSSVYLILIAFALSVDAFSLSVAAGAAYKKCGPRVKFRLSFHIGLFHFLMPVLGFFAGKEITDFLSDFDHWIALSLLSVVGGKMIFDSLQAEENEKKEIDISKGLVLISTSLAVSIDSFAVGLTYGITGADIYFSAFIFALITGGVTLLGLKLGEKISERFNNSLSAAGGIVLILIGIHIVLDHMEYI